MKHLCEGVIIGRQLRQGGEQLRHRAYEHTSGREAGSGLWQYKCDLHKAIGIHGIALAHLRARGRLPHSRELEREPTKNDECVMMLP